MNYGKLTAGTTKTAIDTAKPSEKGEIITYLSRMGDVLDQTFEANDEIVIFVERIDIFRRREDANIVLPQVVDEQGSLRSVSTQPG